MAMTKVKVYKNGSEVGWYKDLVPGINAIKATCENMGYDLKEYELRDYEDEKKVLWRGIEAVVDV
jgi:hypothetical protein